MEMSNCHLNLSVEPLINKMINSFVKVLNCLNLPLNLEKMKWEGICWVLGETWCWRNTKQVSFKGFDHLFLLHFFDWSLVFTFSFSFLTFFFLLEINITIIILGKLKNQIIYLHSLNKSKTKLMPQKKEKGSTFCLLKIKLFSEVCF